MENDHLEKLRVGFKPSRIVLLLVGESPPPQRGFFYDPTVFEGQLSRNTRKAFQDHFRIEYADRQEFLAYFQAKDCYPLPCPILATVHSRKSQFSWC